MDPEKRRRLEAKGWKAVTVAKFLNLSPEEEAVVEIHVTLSKLLRDTLRENAPPPVYRAETMGDKQHFADEVENPVPHMSTDQLLLALLTAGATLKQIGETIAAVTITQTLKSEQAADTVVEPEIRLAAAG